MSGAPNEFLRSIFLKQTPAPQTPTGGDECSAGRILIRIMREDMASWDTMRHDETPKPKHLWVGVIIIIVVVIVVALIWRDRVLSWDSVENPEAILETSICCLRDPSMVFILNVSIWRISKEQPTTGLCNSLSSWTCSFSSTDYSATSTCSFQSFWIFLTSHSFRHAAYFQSMA